MFNKFIQRGVMGEMSMMGGGMMMPMMGMMMGGGMHGPK